MSLAELLEALAEAHDAAAQSLRKRAATTRRPLDPQAGAPPDPLARAYAIHPQLGPRQAEVLELLTKAGPFGTNTGLLSRTMNYDQSNVYLTLRGLIGLGFADRDETTHPHTYRLSKSLNAPSPDEL